MQALDILFTYHGAELLQHRLAILHNFPETTSPHEYTTLLPEARLVTQMQIRICSKKILKREMIGFVLT